ncbi:PucR family transcriptional regulator [Nocardioides pacificus]
MPTPESAGRRARARAADTLLRSVGALSTSAVTRMESALPWFRGLSAEDRSWVGLIIQAGIRAFVEWYRHEARRLTGEHAIAAEVFGAAPQALTRVISLRQTVDLVRLTLEVVEEQAASFLHPDDVLAVHEAVLLYGREVAFATAEVYARAAEQRGAWDARLEALVVDSILRADADEEVLSRASALGWAGRDGVAVMLGGLSADRPQTDLFEDVRRTAQAAGMDALCATQGDRMVVVLGGVERPADASVAPLADLFGPGPVVVGPVTGDLSGAHVSARAALSAHRACTGWPEAPRPVRSGDLLPERALAGDGHARRQLVEEVYLPLMEARGTLLETLTAYLHDGSSLEATGRALFVHTNTVRYRLRQVAELTGLTPSRSRDAFTLRIALVLGRQSGRTPSSL